MCSLRLFESPTVPQTVSNIYTQVARVQLCENDLQHIGSLSFAACQVPLGMEGQLGYGIYFNFISLAQTINQWRREGNPSTLRKPQWQASENVTYYSPKIQAPTKTQTYTVAVEAGNCMENRCAISSTMLHPSEGNVEWEPLHTGVKLSSLGWWNTV